MSRYLTSGCCLDSTCILNESEEETGFRPEETDDEFSAETTSTLRFVFSLEMFGLELERF